MGYVCMESVFKNFNKQDYSINLNDKKVRELGILIRAFVVNNLKCVLLRVKDSFKHALNESYSVPLF